MGPRKTMSFRLTAALVVAACFGLSSRDVAAQQYSHHAREVGASAQTLGIADAVRSMAVGPPALYFNPAGMARVMAYAIQTGYDYTHAYRDPEPVHRHGLTLSVVDSKTNPYVAAGVAYSYMTATDKEGGHQMRAGIASGYRSPSFSALLGVGVRWARFNHKSGGPFGKKDLWDALNADVGALLEIYEMVRIGIVGYNIVYSGSLQDEMPISLGVGLSFSYSGLLVAFDTVIEFESGGGDKKVPIYAVGLEYFAANVLAIRAGFEANQVEEANRITAGIGYAGTIWGVDLGYRHNIADKNDALFALDFRFFLP